jgi:hypothetical protein
MTDEEFVLAVAVVSVLKGEATAEEAAKKIGIPEQTLHEACVKYYDYIDTLEARLANNGKLSRVSEVMIGREVLAAAKYAPEHFKIVTD